MSLPIPVTLIVWMLGVMLAAFQPSQSGLVDPCRVSADIHIKANHYAILCPAIQIDGQIDGDLIGFASTIAISKSGQVNGSVLGAAETVVISGKVSGSIRVAAVHVDLAKDAVVQGQHSDLSVVALDLNSAADLPAALWFFGQTIQINGLVNGERHILLLPTFPPGWISLSADFLSGTLRDSLLLIVLSLLGRLIGSHQIETMLDRAPTQARKQFRNLLIGETFFWTLIPLMLGWILSMAILAGVAVILGQMGLAALVTVVGGAVILNILGGSLLFLILPARIMTIYAIGKKWTARLQISDPATSTLIGLVAGAVFVAALSNLPLIGWILGQMLACFGLGLIWQTIRKPANRV